VSLGRLSNLYRRFTNYYSTGFLSRENSKNSRVNQALLKYGYSLFTLDIIEYCDPLFN
jgi:hypothetical protein